MRNLFLPVAASLILYSCERDETPTPVSNEPVVPTVITMTGADQTTQKINFEYDGDKLKKISYVNAGLPYAVNYEYTGDLITKVIMNDEEGNTVENLQYSGGKLVATNITSVEKSGYYTATTNFTYSYNSDGTVSFKKTYSYKRKIDTAPSTYNSEGIYTMKNGQVVKIVEKNNTYGSTYTTTRTHDTKNGIFKNIKGFASAALGFEEFIAASLSVTQNNYTTINTKADYTANDSGNNFTYEYNANDYPVKMTDTYKEGNQAQEVTNYTITYNR